MPRPIFSFFTLILLASFPALAATGPAPARPVTQAESALLDQAVRRVAEELGRWACTETTVIRDEKGKIKSESVVRYDPSRPYEQQWTPLKINGREPTERDRARYRKRGEHARKRDEGGDSDRRRKTLGELIQFEGAQVAAEEPGHLVFEIPLRKEGNNRFPPDKFQVLARVHREQQRLESVAVRLREPFRSKLVLKVKSGEGTLEFAAIDPKHPPALASIRGDASVSVLFVSVGGALDLQRSDFKHVIPYAERFDVKIGPIKALDF